MLLEAETNKYCPGGNDFGAISNLITWVLDFFLSVGGGYTLVYGTSLLFLSNNSRRLFGRTSTSGKQ